MLQEVQQLLGKSATHTYSCDNCMHPRLCYKIPVDCEFCPRSIWRLCTAQCVQNWDRNNSSLWMLLEKTRGQPGDESRWSIFFTRQGARRMKLPGSINGRPAKNELRYSTHSTHICNFGWDKHDAINWVLDTGCWSPCFTHGSEKKRGHENGWKWYKGGALAGMQVPKLCIMRCQTIFNQLELGATCNTLFQNGLLWPSCFLNLPF